MDTQELHRGQLIDYVQLVVGDIGASKAAQGKLTGRVHLAFQAGSRDVVERAYRAALAAGGRDNGAPGERAYHPGYFAGFVLDPDGNNIEVVFHGPAQRSTPSVKITF